MELHRNARHEAVTYIVSLNQSKPYHPVFMSVNRNDHIYILFRNMPKLDEAVDAIAAAIRGGGNELITQPLLIFARY